MGLTDNLLFLLYYSYLFPFVTCPYPVGEEVEPGSVLLPPTRRGRFIANLVKRQAVDATGIKFNDDADRMNAESKKKVNILSDDLLPYIIAEQERRISLYKRVMTAIQNGEKGVTIAEIRNKPPLIIRKGQMYRCPANRAPIEPDRSGNVACEDDRNASLIVFDSCLSAEDRELYVAENNYFFCNRHKTEGPDLPHNGTTVIGCAPLERTSLNYTMSKCVIEDTDDVLVHYRYYPDRTYKFVKDLDPDNEVCDHWNPCQIGYIFSLPSPDQAITANELWKDTIEEFVHRNAANYSASTRRVRIPAGYRFQKLWAIRNDDNYYGWNPQKKKDVQVKTTVTRKFVRVDIQYPEQWSEDFYSTYIAVFNKTKKKTKTVKFLNILPATAIVTVQKIQFTGTEKMKDTSIPFTCLRCSVRGIIVRTKHSHIHNIDPSMYQLQGNSVMRRQDNSDMPQILEIMTSLLTPDQYGDFYVVYKIATGDEERVKVLEIDCINVKSAKVAIKPGENFRKMVPFKCSNCELTDVLCNGKSVLGDTVKVIKTKAAFMFPKFEDSNACVYMGVFKEDNRLISKRLMTVESAYLTNYLSNTKRSEVHLNICNKESILV